MPVTKNPKESAEKIAILALSYIVDDPDQTSHFLSLSGIDPNQVRNAATEPWFLAGVMEYVMQHEHILLKIAEGEAIAPEAIARAYYEMVGPPA